MKLYNIEHRYRSKPDALTRRRFISDMAVGRRENWSVTETAALVDGVAERYDIIKGKFSPFLTAEKKGQAWEEIRQGVNACSLTTRDAKSVKKKWIDVQSQTRKREAGRRREQKKTGGGPPPLNLKPWEDKIISLIDVSMITGMEGGFDASEHAAVPGPSCSAKTTPFEPPQPIESNVPHTFVLPSSAGDSPHECPSKPKKKRPAVESASIPDLSMSLLEIQKEKLSLKRELLNIEKKKLKVMDNILLEIKQKSCCCSFSMDPLSQFQPTSKPASCSVSPTIKGIVISEM